MVAVLVVMTSACSLALSGPDPQRASNVAPRCDTGKGLVALDWVAGAVLATIAIGALEADVSEAAAVSALSAAAFVASATRGNGVVNRCREDFALYSPAMRDPDEEVARRPRPTRFDDPYAQPSDLPARRVVKPSPAAAPRVATPPLAANPPPATTTPPPATTPSAPAPRTPAPDADEWSEFWTEVP
ncbi:MAG: hypothetical protein H0T42_08670 [Deltaproteobacteria bacterium]|nr:hypothetical protein [Deltaproteobacteria bacterium]